MCMALGGAEAAAPEPSTLKPAPCLYLGTLCSALSTLLPLMHTA